MSKEKKLLINTIIIGVGKFSSQIIVFFMLPLYTSQLSTSEYGTYDSLIAIATFLTPFITLLTEESMFRYLIEYRDSSKKSNIITNTVIYCLTSLGVFTILYSCICIFIDFQYKWYFLIYLIFNVLYAISNAVARGLGKIKDYSISNFIANVLMVIFNLIAILVLKAGVPGLFISYALGILFAILFIIKRLDILKYISLRNFDKKIFKDMIKYSIPLVPNSISWSIINVSDRIMLTYMCSASSNGIYSVSNKFPQAMGSVYNFFSMAWKESASIELGDKSYYSKIFKNIMKLLLIVEIYILLILPFVYGIFVDESFIESYKYVPILLIAMLFSNISEYFSGILIAYKNTKVIGITTIIAAILNIFINILLIKKYEILAASISTLIATLTICILRIIITKKYINIKIKTSEFMPYFIICVFSIISYYIENSIIRIALLIICSIIIAYLNKELLKYYIGIVKEKVARNEK